MAGFKDFREIAAWRLSRDAARSAPRNIAEGFARYKHKEFAQFVRIANGALAEVLDHFIDAVDNGYLSAEKLPQHPTHLLLQRRFKVGEGFLDAMQKRFLEADAVAEVAEQIRNRGSARLVEQSFRRNGAGGIRHLSVWTAECVE